MITRYQNISKKISSSMQVTADDHHLDGLSLVARVLELVSI